MTIIIVRDIESPPDTIVDLIEVPASSPEPISKIIEDWKVARRAHLIESDMDADDFQWLDSRMGLFVFIQWTIADR